MRIQTKLPLLFKGLMTIAILMSAMPSFLRLDGSRISLSYLFIVACLFLLLLILLKDRFILSFFHFLSRHNTVLVFALLALVLLHVIRFVFSPEDGLISRSFISLLIFITSYSYFAFLFYVNRDDYHYFYRLISFALFLNLAVAMLQKQGILLEVSAYDGHDRYSGLFSHPNQLAIFVTTITVYYINSFVSQTRAWGKFLALVLIASCLITLTMAGSKTNIVISMCVAALFMLFSARHGGLFNLAITLAFAIVVYMLIYKTGLLQAINPRLFDVLSSLTVDNIGEYRTIMSRFDTWEYSWKVGTSYPFLGEGFVNSELVHSHNLFFNYLRMFGPLGMLLSMLFVASLGLFRHIRNTTFAPDNALLVSKLSILAYLSVNMMSDSMGPQTVFFLGFFTAVISSETLRHVSMTMPRRRSVTVTDGQTRQVEFTL